MCAGFGLRKTITILNSVHSLIQMLMPNSGTLELLTFSRQGVNMAVKQLWVEKYRPTSIDSYVFRDAAQKRQIDTWIKEKSIPHLLFSGSPGTGKCLDGNEEIVVRIEIDSLTADQIEKLSRYKS